MEFIAYAEIKCDETDHEILWTEEPYADLYNSTVLKLLVKTDFKTQSVKMDGGRVSIERLGKRLWLYYDWENRKVIGGNDEIGATATILQVCPETNTKFWIK